MYSYRDIGNPVCVCKEILPFLRKRKDSYEVDLGSWDIVEEIDMAVQDNGSSWMTIVLSSRYVSTLNFRQDKLVYYTLKTPVEIARCIPL